MSLSELAVNRAFEYVIRVQPHHTDYAGIVWHGTYVAWLEEARVEYLRTQGIEFAHWVGTGVDLPVVDLSLRYHQSLTLGAVVLVKAWVTRKGVRIVWHYQIVNQETQDLCVSAQVTLVPVDHVQRKVLRRLPPSIQSDFERLFQDG